LSIEFLAGASLVGISPDKFLHTDSEVELECLILVAEKAVELYNISQRNLAAQIINFLGQSLTGKKSSGVQRDN